VTYLDTGCFVKLYYPEPDSAKVIALIQGKALCHTPLHEPDLKAGVLVSPNGDWQEIFAEAVNLAEQHTATIGCRSLDIAHCAAAKLLAATEFISTDARQKKLAVAMGLNLMTF